MWSAAPSLSSRYPNLHDGRHRKTSTEPNAPPQQFAAPSPTFPPVPGCCEPESSLWASCATGKSRAGWGKGGQTPVDRERPPGLRWWRCRNRRRQTGIGGGDIGSAACRQQLYWGDCCHRRHAERECRRPGCLARTLWRYPNFEVLAGAGRWASRAFAGRVVNRGTAGTVFDRQPVVNRNRHDRCHRRSDSRAGSRASLHGEKERAAPVAPARYQIFQHHFPRLLRAALPRFLNFDEGFGERRPIWQGVRPPAIAPCGSVGAAPRAGPGLRELP